MKSIVKYTPHAPKETPHRDKPNSLYYWEVERRDVRRLREYLAARDIEIYYVAASLRSLTIEYKSAAHRTCIELIMSGCPTDCRITTEELVSI